MSFLRGGRSPQGTCLIEEKMAGRTQNCLLQEGRNTIGYKNVLVFQSATRPIDGWAEAQDRPAEGPAKELEVAMTGLGWLWDL